VLVKAEGDRAFEEVYVTTFALLDRVRLQGRRQQQRGRRGTDRKTEGEGSSAWMNAHCTPQGNTIARRKLTLEHGVTWLPTPSLAVLLPPPHQVWLERKASYMQFNEVLKVVRGRLDQALGRQPTTVASLQAALGLPRL
jgi:hypothetical protein